MTSQDHDPSALPLVAEGLTVSYNGAPALEGLTFRIARGSQVAVVGPNGAGKTTLFKVIAGLLRPSAGTISVHGHPPGRHVCVAYVPQRTQVDWSFPVSVKDVVMMARTAEIGLFRRPRRSDYEVVEAALERGGIADLGERQIGELSGGQQQRVFLAQALAQQAEILLLDEPLTGLDAPTQDLILGVLAGLRSENVTVLVATHDLNLAAERFDRVMLLNRRLIALGPPKEVFTRRTLLEAYGGHLHVLIGDDSVALLTDTHHEGRE